MMAMQRTLLLAAMGVWLAATGPSAADSCWDTRQLVGRGAQKHDFPFPVYFGALPAEVKRCQVTGAQVMQSLAEVRQDPTLLEKEKRTGRVYYRDRLACCAKWTGFRCQNYPPPPNEKGTYGSTHLEGYIGPASGCAEPLPRIDVVPKPPIAEPLPRGNPDKLFKVRP